MSTTAVDQDTPTAAPDTGSQLTAPNRSLEVDGDTSSTAGSATRRPTSRRWSFCSTSAATSTTGTRSSSTESPGTARSSCSPTAASAPRPDRPRQRDDMARDVLRFVDALGLEQIDLLGFSLGGYIAQELALLAAPGATARARRHRTPGRPDLHRWSDDVYAHAAADVTEPDTPSMLFFSGSEESRAKGMEYLQRTQSRRTTATNRRTWRPATRSSLRSLRGGSPIRRSSTGWRESSSRPSSPSATTTR